MVPLRNRNVDRQLVDGERGHKKPCSTLLNCPCAECEPAMAVLDFVRLADEHISSLYHESGATSILISRIQTRLVSRPRKLALLTLKKQQTISGR